MAVDPAALAEAVRAVRGTGIVLTPDAWSPSVQGAVGHVVGVRDADGRPCVLKLYPAAAGARFATERRALRLASTARGLAVPRVVADGELAAPGFAGFVLMTRLPGARWADRRPALGAAGNALVTRGVGAAMRRLHAVEGPGFGSLLDDGERRHGTAWEFADATLARTLDDYVGTGGTRAVAARVRAYVDDRRAAFASCGPPALCHRDLIDGNVLLAGATSPRVSGVVDLEAACWDDPMSDLAQTRVHVRFHAPAHVADLLAGYGEPSADELARLDVHDALHSARERAWIATDRPVGWRAAVAALDARLAALA